MTNAAMTPVEITDRAHTLRSGGPSRTREVWEARSTDGTWTYVRTDEPGTPWTVTHEPTGLWYMFGSLPKARRFTARPDALAFLETVAAQTAAANAHTKVWRAS